MNDKLRDLEEKILKKASEIQIEVISIILFGSLAKGNSDNSSDIDIFVVVNDKSNEEEIDKLKKFMYSYEEEIGIRIKPSSIKSKALMVFDRIGAQYKSMFVCRQNDFENSRPGPIFKTESKFDGIILDNPLLRNDIGFKNIMLSSKVLYGKDIIPKSTNLTPIEKKQFAQNRITYSLLNFYALIIYPLSKNATKYSLSATKWAMHSCYFIETKDPGNLAKEIAYFKKRYSSETLNSFGELRNNYKPSIKYILRAQGFIWQLFTNTLKETKFPVHVGRE